jgi:hypothetical protein
MPDGFFINKSNNHGGKQGKTQKKNKGAKDAKYNRKIDVGPVKFTKQ